MLDPFRFRGSAATSPLVGVSEGPLAEGAALDAAGLGPTPSGPATLGVGMARPGPASLDGLGGATFDPEGLDGRAPLRGAAEPGQRSTPTVALPASTGGARSTPSTAPDLAESAESPRLIAGRYLPLGTLGEGGMGVVYKVRDQQLGSLMAMKVIRPALMGGATALARFVEEAQATAQLQHPGVVAVHELGRLPDGRMFFTMELVEGRTLSDVLAELHAATRAAGRWSSARAWTLRRVLGAFHQACQVVAYAHARGVIHRDLKPENIMLGEFGEVRVLDWGLARVLGRSAGEADAVGSGLADLSPLGRSRPHATRVGAVAGTLAYMAPEQARGEIDHIGAQADVFALGATLYHALCGAPPFDGPMAAALAAARAGAVPRPAPLDATSPALLELLEAALAPNPHDRPADAGALARALGDWLDGARRRDDGLAQVALADERSAQVSALADELDRALQVVHIEQRDLPRPASPERLASLWAAEDAVSALRSAHTTAEQAMLEHLRLGLNHDPTLPEAHARLAAHYRRRHAERATAEPAKAGLWESLVRRHDLAGEHADWLSGEGTVELRCAQRGATVRLSRYVERGRRLVPEPLAGPLSGALPLPLVTRLPAGSYLAELEAPGHLPAPVPLLVDRAALWDNTPPEGGGPQAIALPPLGASPHAPDDPPPAFIAAGWAWVGARRPERRIFLRARRVWVDDLWVDRHPVTNAQFLRFLDDLVARGDEAAALRHAPRYRAAAGGEGALIYGRRADGGFCLVPDGDGDQWQPDWPVVMVTWSAARAYADWRAARTGHPWRLPTELEWRKALGGVDGRSYPWGEAEVDAFANTRFGRPGRMMLTEVGSHPEDQSPYGVFGGAGGVMDWCLDSWAEAGPPVDPRGRPLPSVPDPEAQHPLCGGAWTWPVAACTLNTRNVAPPTLTREWWGLRLCCAPGPDAPGAP